MKCPRTHLIVRLLSGDLPPPEQRDLGEHLETCPICAAAYSEMYRTWNALGDWSLDLSGIDLTDRILREADPEGSRTDRRIRSAAYAAVSLRTAASILLAVGVGVAAGHLVPTGKSAAGVEPPATLEGLTEALESIGVASESATGLPLDLEPDETTTGDGTS